MKKAFQSMDQKYHTFINKNNWLAYIINFFKFVFEFFIVAWIVITITFFLVNSLPGSNTLTANLSDAQKIAIEAKYHLNDPIFTRYLNYLANLFHGDFGISLSLFPAVEINDFIWSRFLTSFTIGILSVVITLLIGVPLGVLIGRKPGGFLDNSSTVVISILISIPALIFALLLLILGKAIGIPYIYDRSNFATYILPALALSLVSIVTYVRYIRTEMNAELNSMHAKFAYLKGVSNNRFVWKHALKPALFPIATFFPIVVLGSFIGGLFTEQIFQVPGSGGLLINAIQTKDYNIILFLVIIYSLLTIVSFALRDALYKLLDPRVRGRR